MDILGHVFCPRTGIVPAFAPASVHHSHPLTQNVAGISPEEIAAHFNLLPDRYFAQTDEEEVALHLAMVNRLLHNISAADSLGSLRPVIEWRELPDRNCCVAHVVTWDRAGLFHKLAGALSVAGCNILSARITTRDDHIAIDCFEVAPPDDHAAAQALFARTVESALVANRDLAPAIAELSGRFPSQTDAPAPRVEVYLEVSSPRAIVEIRAPDRFGLLYRVGRTIAEKGFSLTAARVDTERGQAIDRFHLESADDRAVDNARLVELRDALASVAAAR
jgi:[protein-PII] uridylyltransferase